MSDDTITLYTAADSAQASLLVELLDEQGIRAMVVNENLQFGAAELVGYATQPRIVVFRRDAERAQAVAQAFDDRLLAAAGRKREVPPPPTERPSTSVQFSLRRLFSAMFVFAIAAGFIGLDTNGWPSENRLAMLATCSGLPIGFISFAILIPLFRHRASLRAGKCLLCLPPAHLKLNRWITTVGAIGLSYSIARVTHLLFEPYQVPGPTRTADLFSYVLGFILTLNLGIFLAMCVTIFWPEEGSLCELCENGILSSASFSPWSSVESYRIAPVGSSMIVLKLRRYKKLGYKVFVPVENRERALAILADKLGPPTDEDEFNDDNPLRTADTLAAWPLCPDCHQPRHTMCEACGTAGSDFPPADPPPHVGDSDSTSKRSVGKENRGGEEDAATPDEQPTLRVICPTCDEPFVPVFLRRCQWCGHDFGEGRDYDVAPATSTTAPADETVNYRRVFFLAAAILAVLAALVVYFAAIIG